MSPAHGSTTTLMAPDVRSPATRKASAASSRGKRWVMSVGGKVRGVDQHLHRLLELRALVEVAVGEGRDQGDLLHQQAHADRDRLPVVGQDADGPTRAHPRHGLVHGPLGSGGIEDDVVSGRRCPSRPQPLGGRHPLRSVTLHVHEAPMATATATAHSPIGPAPMTSTLAPGARRTGGHRAGPRRWAPPGRPPRGPGTEGWAWHRRDRPRPGRPDRRRGWSRTVIRRPPCTAAPARPGSGHIDHTAPQGERPPGSRRPVDRRTRDPGSPSTARTKPCGGPIRRCPNWPPTPELPRVPDREGRPPGFPPRCFSLHARV